MVIFLVVGKEIQQKNEWLIMIKLHQSKNILRVSNHKIIFSELVIFLSDPSPIIGNACQ